MKLWDKGISIDKTIEAFTVGDDRAIDLHIASYDLRASLAHAKMLAQVEILDKNERKQVEHAIAELQKEVDAGAFIIDDDFEDVHSKIEFELTQRIGEAGKKIHTARSRNDQVLVDLKLFTRAELMEVVELIQPLFDKLIELSEKHKDVLIPGYTHYQVAMPSSFGLWFGAFHQSIQAPRVAFQHLFGG